MLTTICQIILKVTRYALLVAVNLLAVSLACRFLLVSRVADGLDRARSWAGFLAGKPYDPNMELY